MVPGLLSPYRYVEYALMRTAHGTGLWGCTHRAVEGNTIYPVFVLRRLARRLKLYRKIRCILRRLARRLEINTGYIVSLNSMISV